MKIIKSQNAIGAEIRDVDLARPLSADFGRIEAAFNAHSVVSFPRQHVNEEQLIAFAGARSG